MEDMDVWRDRVQHDISELKNNQNQILSDKRKIEKDVQELQISDKLQNQDIQGLKDSLSRIQEDTQWIRRRITGALITATITAVVAGIVGIAIANIF